LETSANECTKLRERKRKRDGERRVLKREEKERLDNRPVGIAD
jgi:hypothetical protein